MRPNNQPPPSSQLPRLLRLLPETLPFYPYRRTDDGMARRPHSNRRRRSRRNNNNPNDDDDATGSREADPEKNDYPTTKAENEEGGGRIIPSAPLMHTGRGGRRGGVGVGGENNPSFSLFFFVDSTNRQSLNAIPKVSHWFRHALRGGGGDDDFGGDGNYDDYYSNGNNDNNNNRVICVPNHPSPNEVGDDDDDEEGPAIRAAVVHDDISSIANDRRRRRTTTTAPCCTMLMNSGFYRLPFLHPQRLALIHLLGATRVPSIVVVSNHDGRVVTRHGWEAIDRELWKLNDWIERTSVEGKKRDDDDDDDEEEEEEDGGEGRSSRRRYESYVVGEWGNGNSGLPLYWNILGWIL